MWISCDQGCGFGPQSCDKRCVDELKQLQNTQRMEYREWVCKVHEDLMKKGREMHEGR